jgi:hypothetical protein
VTTKSSQISSLKSRHCQVTEFKLTPPAQRLEMPVTECSGFTGNLPVNKPAKINLDRIKPELQVPSQVTSTTGMRAGPAREAGTVTVTGLASARPNLKT